MNPFTAYHIPFLGLKAGVHTFDFVINESFFEEFEYSEISKGNFTVDLKLEKQSTMMVLDFSLEGKVEDTCDRCGMPITLEVTHEDRLIVKYGDETKITEDEILVVSQAEHILELEQYLYEYSHLALPSRRVCDNEDDCDQDALDLLDSLQDDDEDDDIDPRWEALKGLK
ncbi:MAG: DUF177 domain-containing protein [Flavobacteriales bacterium]|jgi:uncharacterized protein|nr:DUF177 domain-containing protein [Flavobacteriales bacterium]